MSLMPNFVISMPGDVRTECKFTIKEFSKKETQRKRPARLTFYDTKGGASGSGISTKAFEFVDTLLKQASHRLQTCQCLEGCHECCCDDRCKHANQVMSKAGAMVIVMCLLGKESEIDINALPWGEDDVVAAGIETIVPAETVKMARGKIIDGVLVKEEEDDEDHFARSIYMYGGERTFIGVHKDGV
jgi:DEAD/DEAH box helicase domain-containing protein